VAVRRRVSRIYVGLEKLPTRSAAIDTATNTVIAKHTDRTGTASDRLCFRAQHLIPTIARNLQPLGVAGQVAHLALGDERPEGRKGANPAFSLFDQGLIQVLQALGNRARSESKKYVLALADRRGRRRPLANRWRPFMTNPGRICHCQRTGPESGKIVQRIPQLSRRALSGHCPREMQTTFGEASTGAKPGEW